jgi:hypothetical protein
MPNVQIVDYPYEFLPNSLDLRSHHRDSVQDCLAILKPRLDGVVLDDLDDIPDLRHPQMREVDPA